MNATATVAPGYVIATLRDVEFCEELDRYAREIEATLLPYEGRFVLRSSVSSHLEGTVPADFVVLIGFPSVEQARSWYASPAYQAILELRTRHSDSALAVLEPLPS